VNDSDAMNLVTLKDFVIFTESQGAGVSVLDFVFLYKVGRCGCVICHILPAYSGAGESSWTWFICDISRCGCVKIQL